MKPCKLARIPKIREGATIAPGTKVTGEVTVGSKGAKATFEFVAPLK